LYPLLMVYAFVYVGYGFLLLLSKYRRSTGLAKAQIRFLFWGFVLFLSGTITCNIIMPALGVAGVAFISPIFSLFLIGFVSYSIIRYRLMDISLILGKGVIASFSLAIVVIMPVVAVVILNDQILVPRGIPRFVAPLIVAVFVVLGYPKVQSFFELRLGKYLAGEVFTFRELLRQSQRVFVEEIKLETLAQELVELLNRSFAPRWQTILVASGQRSAEEIPYRVYSFGKKIDSQKIPLKFFKQLEKLAEGELFLTTEALHQVKATPSVGRTLEVLEAEVCAPLFSRGRFVGVFLLGPRQRGKVYSKEELDILQMVINQAAISVDNARLYRETQDFNVTLQEEIKKATAKLRQAYEKLKELDKMKDDFVSITSHELRTPMTAIQGYLWMLENKGGPLNEKQSRYLVRAQRGATRMLSLVNDMLDVSRIEQERLELNIREIDLVPIINDVVEELQVRAEKKKLKLVSLVGEAKLPRVKADAEKVHRVLTNLLDNAVKFTERGSVTVDAYQKGKFVQVSVTDTGRGISKGDMPRLFKKFGRLESDFVTAAEAGGTGLGLYISRALVERMRGKMSVQSEVGRGSTFSFTLPVV